MKKHQLISKKQSQRETTLVVCCEYIIGSVNG